MHATVRLIVISVLSSTAAHAADWKTTFAPNAVATYLTGEGLAVAVVPAGKPLKEAQAAALALSAALKAAKGAKSVVKVPQLNALAKLDDAAIVARAAKSKAAHVLIVRMSPGNEGQPSASLAIYDKEGTLLDRLTAVAGSPLASKGDNTADDAATKAVTTAGSAAESPKGDTTGTTRGSSTEPAATTSAPPAASGGSSEGSATSAGQSTPASEPATPSTPAAQPAPSDVDTLSDDRHSLFLDVALGLHSTSQAVSSGTGGTASADGSLALEIHPAYRYSNTQAVGVSYFRNMYSMPASTSMLFHGAMLNWRYYVPIGLIDPFAELGVGWCWLTTSVTAGTFKTVAAAKGVNLAAALGAVYYIFDYLGVGLIARYNLPAFTSLCIKTNGAETCGTPSSNMKDLSYAVEITFKPLAL
jgi:hypothetical protein